MLKGHDRSLLKKNYIMDENDPLSEYNKIPLGHNLKSTSKLRSALPFIYSIVIPHFISRANTAQS